MVVITPINVNTKIIIAWKSVIVTPVLVGGHNIAQVKTASDGKGTSLAVSLGAKALLDGTRRGSDGWNLFDLFTLLFDETLKVKVAFAHQERATFTNGQMQVWTVAAFFAFT